MDYGISTGKSTRAEGRDKSRPEQARSIERRAQLLAAAVQLLLSGGALAVTHRKVAEISSSSPGSVRYYFQSREDLLAACLGEIERIRGAEAERVKSVAQQECQFDVRETAQLALRAYYGPDLDDATVTGAVWTVMDCWRESPRLAELLGQQRQVAIEQVRAVLSACGYGTFRPELAANVMDGAIITATLDKNHRVAEVAIADLAEVLQLSAK